MIQTLRKVKVPFFFGVRIALFDLSLSLLSGWYVAGKLKFNRLAGALLTLPMGFLAHEIVKIKTPLNEAIKKKLK